MFEDLSHPVIPAHRGVSAHAPENTLAAFGLALSQGADSIELDARLSADGRVVIIHDPTVDRTTNGHGGFASLSDDATKQQILRVYRLNRHDHVCAVNQAEDIIRLKNWGVDRIYTDDPQLALRALGRSL